MSDTEKCVRDRLGLWGIGGNDAEVPGNVTGLQRIKQSRYNKVSKGRTPHFYIVRILWVEIFSNSFIEDCITVKLHICVNFKRLVDNFSSAYLLLRAQ